MITFNYNINDIKNLYYTVVPNHNILYKIIKSTNVFIYEDVNLIDFFIVSNDDRLNNPYCENKLLNRDFNKIQLLPLQYNILFNYKYNVKIDIELEDLMSNGDLQIIFLYKNTNGTYTEIKKIDI